MNANTKAEANALSLPQRAAVALGAAEHEIKLRDLVKSSVDIVAVIDPAGREQAHRIGMTLKHARVAIEKASKGAREDAVAFGKAVIAEEKRLIEIVTGEETRVFTLRDEYDEKVEAERQAVIAAEVARVAKIADALEGIRERETDALRKCKTAEETQIEITALEAMEITEAVFQERAGEAADLKACVLVAMRAIHADRVQAEAAEAERIAAAKAEAARMEAERQELIALRAAADEATRAAKAEADRVAAEHAAESRRLAALAAAQEEQMRVERERAAEAQRAANAELQAAQAKLAAEVAAHELKLRIESDFDEALVIDAEFDATREAERARLQEAAAQHLAEVRGPLSLEELAADAGTDDLEPTDLELLDVLVETFGLTLGQIIDRLAGMDFDSLRSESA